MAKKSPSELLYIHANQWSTCLTGGEVQLCACHGVFHPQLSSLCSHGKDQPMVLILLSVPHVELVLLLLSVVSGLHLLIRSSSILYSFQIPGYCPKISQATLSSRSATTLFGSIRYVKSFSVYILQLQLYMTCNFFFFIYRRIIAPFDIGHDLMQFMLVANSGYIRRKVMESERANLGCIDLSDMPGGAEVFEKAAKFCYGMNFEISVHNVAALRCAAEYLQMTEDYSRGNLAERAEEFINQAAVKTLPGAVALLRSCEGSLLPMAEEVRIVQRSVDAISLKVSSALDIYSFNQKNDAV